MRPTLRAAVAVALLVAGCRTGKPILDTSKHDPRAHGTIGGILQAQGGGDALPGRRVEAIAVDGSARFTATTNVAGGFSIEVPPGHYRLKVELRDGEGVTKDPGVIDINSSDLDANIVVEVGRGGR
jgi:hypothetical protein